MNIEIINNSKFKNLVLMCADKQYTFSENNNCQIVNISENEHIKICILEENTFYFDLPAILTISFSHKDSWCSIKCNIEFDVECVSNCQNSKLILTDKKSSYKKRYTFESLRIEPQNCLAKNLNYKQSDTSKIRKKHKKFNLFITSLLPIIILDLILMFVDGDILYLFAGIVGICVFLIPSLADIKKFRKVCTNSNIVQDCFADQTNQAS